MAHDDYLEDIEQAMEQEQFSPAVLSAIEAQVIYFIELEHRMLNLEDQLKKAKQKHSELKYRVLPDLMSQARISNMTLANFLIEAYPEISASLPSKVDKSGKKNYANLKRRKDILNWLIDNGHGGVIKSTMTIELPKGDQVLQMKIVEAVAHISNVVRVEIDETVHGSTYKALCKRLIKDGANAPLDTLNIFVGRAVKVTEKYENESGSSLVKSWSDD